MAGKLTLSEKYEIQGRLHEGQDIKAIATDMSRDKKTIQNFVDGELAKTVSAIEKIAKDKPKAPKMTQAQVDKEAKNELIVKGLHPGDAEDLIKLAHKKAEKNGKITLDKVGKLVASALRCIGAKTTMITKTQKGSKGVAINNAVASAHGDSHGEQARGKNPHGRMSKGNLYDIEGDKIISTEE